MSAIYLGDLIARTAGNREIIITEWPIHNTQYIYEGTVNAMIKSLSFRFYQSLEYRRVEHIDVINGKLVFGLTDLRTY